VGFSDCADIFHHASASDLQAHNLKVAGSNPAPATNDINSLDALRGVFFYARSAQRSGQKIKVAKKVQAEPDGHA
tara:strand:- start:145 stop:369 length:225 start_codon:yes stop_codon:yes gene_type:complete